MVEISPSKRARIIREIHAHPQRQWKGHIHGHLVELRVDRLPMFGGLASVRWRVCCRRRWQYGIADTVWEALQEVERCG